MPFRILGQSVHVIAYPTTLTTVYTMSHYRNVSDNNTNKQANNLRQIDSQLSCMQTVMPRQSKIVIARVTRPFHIELKER
jgi:hypothetical protein